jgi:hypothetical protein
MTKQLATLAQAVIEALETASSILRDETRIAEWPAAKRQLRVADRRLERLVDTPPQIEILLGMNPSGICASIDLREFIRDFPQEWQRHVNTLAYHARVSLEEHLSANPKAKRRRRPTDVTSKESEFVDAWVACGNNAAAASKKLGIAKQTGTRRLNRALKKYAAEGINLNDLVDNRPKPRTRQLRFEKNVADRPTR